MARYGQDTAPLASDVPFAAVGAITENNVQDALVQVLGLLLAKTADVTVVVVLDETAYAALSPPDATTLYLVKPDA